MTAEQELKFLWLVQETCKDNPHLIAEVVQAANSGLKAKLSQLNEKLADVESLAVLAMARRTKNIDRALLDKLKKINGKTCFVWDSTIKELENKQ